jgi:pimeloyl-ACP methyl ester carboxylesterase
MRGARRRRAVADREREGAMRRSIMVLALSLAAGSAWAQSKEPILLREMGSFHIGGRVIEITGQPIKEVVFTPGGVPAKMDPNGKYQVEQMYVQYFLPQNRRGKLPLLLWHGGGLTGVTYETKPDGDEGWLTYFIRKGWDTYISDAVERGRAGWTNTFKGDPLFLPVGDPWERFRIGPPGSWNDDKAKRATYPGVQFPIEAYEQFMKQAVPRWLTTDERIVAAYVELVDKLCPCVVMVHSQSGSFGYKVLEARPEKVKALIAVEPTLAGDRNKVEAIKGTPILVLYGDNAKDHPRWSKIRQGGVDYAAVLKSAGGSIDVVDLPEVGIKGNSHMVMMDKNSDVVADLIQKWLVSKGLAD